MVIPLLFPIITQSEKIEIPTKSVDQHDGTYKFCFKLPSSGVYRIEIELESKDGKSAKVKGSPLKLNLTIPEQKVTGKYPTTMICFVADTDFSRREHWVRNSK